MWGARGPRCDGPTLQTGGRQARPGTAPGGPPPSLGAPAPSCYVLRAQEGPWQAHTGAAMAAPPRAARSGRLRAVGRTKARAPASGQSARGRLGALARIRFSHAPLASRRLTPERGSNEGTALAGRIPTAQRGRCADANVSTTCHGVYYCGGSRHRQLCPPSKTSHVPPLSTRPFPPSAGGQQAGARGLRYSHMSHPILSRSSG